ncbi:MAG: alpha-ketoglutarate-dependent dioxygenase AlkB [Chitinophagaceae bacterium]|nr:MAG: alpha-ketoglutarate-dependent dioxygenase AlkB [Chitinophagaceae bacterium]
MTDPKDIQSIIPYHGEVLLYPGFFTTETADELMGSLLGNIPWKQEPIRIFGREVMQPRLTCWMADKGVDYSYSGSTMIGNGWIEPADSILELVSAVAGTRFNGALFNLYRDGQDSMGWHRDNEKELGPNPVIASVTFGQERIFRFRDYKTKKEKFEVLLTHGSLLIMRGETQHYWEHSIPKSKAINEKRINITFRRLGNFR